VRRASYYVWVYRITQPVAHAELTFLNNDDSNQATLAGSYTVGDHEYHGICHQNRSEYTITHEGQVYTCQVNTGHTEFAARHYQG